MAFILGRATAFSAEDRGRAEEVVETREFRNWVTSKERSSLGDGALLIHGDYDLGDYPEISPLSALCVAFVQMLRIRHEYIGLVFFCGRHLEKPHDSNPGPSGLMRSLIAQLVRQHPAVFTQMQEPGISLEDIRESQNNLSYLISLFAAMVRQLPVSNTVFVLLDGVLFYERFKYRENLLQVINGLLELTNNQFKMLVASPAETRTRDLSTPFRKRKAILSMKSMPNTGRGPSRRGVAKRIGMELTKG